jgi:type I restriction enzyme S subunit
MSEWTTKPLKEVADIRVSNVDKKSARSERPIRLCNYMDVYSRHYLHDSDAYMEATCTDRELSAFALKRDDLIITKDSEDPDDIAIPALIDDDVSELVCGYHLAIVRPKPGAIDPAYLLVQLRSEPIKSYFAKRASGSTRYGLSLRTIAETPIPVAPEPRQKIAGHVQRTVDAQIKQTEALIAKQELVRSGLMQDLFCRGVDAHGRLRPPREQAPDLYHHTPLGWLPNEWDTPLLDSAARRVSGHTPNRKIPGYWNGGIKWVSLADSWRLDQRYIRDTEYEISQLGIENSSAQLHPSGTVVLSRDAGVGKSAILAESMAVSQHFMAWICGPKLHNRFLYYYLQTSKRLFENIASGSTIVTIGLPFFKRMLAPLPGQLDEQVRIANILEAVDTSIFDLSVASQKLHQLRAGLMRDLLTSSTFIPTEAAA